MFMSFKQQNSKILLKSNAHIASVVQKYLIDYCCIGITMEGFTGTDIPDVTRPVIALRCVALGWGNFLGMASI